MTFHDLHQVRRSPLEVFKLRAKMLEALCPFGRPDPEVDALVVHIQSCLRGGIARRATKASAGVNYYY